MEPTRDAAVLVEHYERYEESWQAVRARTAAICNSADAVRTDIRRASQRCDAAARGWQHLQDELRLLPQTTQLMQEMTTRTADIFAKLETLEERLTDLTVTQVHRREKSWRLRRLER
eukprot:5888005-Prymnesium_polylepis.1